MLTPLLKKISQAHFGAYIIDLDSQSTVYKYNAHQLFIPASTAKLFTTLGALNHLPIGFHFRTSVFLEGSFLEGHLKGDLILSGGGDPMLSSRDIMQLAEQIYEKGVRYIEGAVLLEEDFLQGRHLTPHLEWSDLTWDYACEVSTLSIDSNALTLSIEPNTELLQPAVIKVDQIIPYVTIVNKLITVEKTAPPGLLQGNDYPFPLKIQRGLLDNTIEISGEIPIDAEKISEKIALHQSSKYARLMFIHYLNLVGITFVENKFPQKNEKKRQELVFVERSLLDVLKKINKESDNLASELLLRTIGRKCDQNGSYSKCYLENGLKAIREWLQQQGITTSDYVLFDGSGVSRRNLISPEQIVSILNGLFHSSLNPTFIETLPIAGVDGTLQERFNGTKGENIIYAKTGSMSDITTLAGYIFPSSGRKLAFSVCVNHHRISTKECRELVDDFLLTFID